MSWIDEVTNGRGVLAVYGGEAPSLQRVELQSVVFTSRGPSAGLAVALRDYPAEPPAKWAAQGFNTVQLLLNCIGIESVRMTSWSNVVVGDISVERLDGLVSVTVDAPGTDLRLVVDSVDVQKVSAYLRVPDDEITW